MAGPPNGNVVPLQLSVALVSLHPTLLRFSHVPQLVTLTDSSIVGSAQLAALVQVLVTQIAGTGGGTEHVAESESVTTVVVIAPVPEHVTVSEVD
jgi:hypothetical protein